MMKTHPNLPTSQSKWLPDSIWSQDEGDPSLKTPLPTKLTSPAIPQRYPPTPPTGLQRSASRMEAEEDEALMEAEMMEHHLSQSLDWVFKCATITLLVLNLFGLLCLFIQGRSSPSPSLDAPSLSQRMGGAYKYDPRFPNLAVPVPPEPDMYGRVGGPKEPPTRLSMWVKTSGLGKTGYRLVGVPAMLIKSVLTVVWAPIKYILSKLVSIAYICLFMTILVLVIYWILHGFLTQTLGDWFMKRLNLPAPKALVHEFSSHVGKALFNRWWSLTELIKENIMNYFNCNIDTFNGGYTYGAGTGLGSTPNPLLRRRGSVWGPKYRGVSIGNAARPSIHYPKPNANIYTGMTGLNDQKRRLNTINETHDPLANRAGYQTRAPAAQQFSHPLNNPLTQKIHHSPIRSNKFTFHDFDKENDDEFKPTGFASTFSNSFSNPIASPLRPGGRPAARGPFGTNVANRNAERNQKASAAQGPPLGANSGRFRGKRGGVAFNVG